MADFTLSDLEKKRLTQFLDAVTEVAGKDWHEVGGYSLIFTPAGGIGIAVEVVFEYKDGSGGKITFKRDLTDHGSW